MNVSLALSNISQYDQQHTIENHRVKRALPLLASNEKTCQGPQKSNIHRMLIGS
jgi:hypothetical protein